MRAHDHRLALVAQPANVVDHDLAAEHIQPARRFIEQHDGRRVNERSGERHALPLARAQQRAAAVEQRRQIEQVRPSVRRLSLALRGGTPYRSAKNSSISRTESHG